MENLEAVLESTYLKTAVEAQLTESENLDMVVGFVKQAITHNFVLVMLRPKHLTIAKDIIIQNSSSLRLGTVIDFPLGISDTHEKIKEAEIAITNGANELDFVLNYQAYLNHEYQRVKNEILDCTKYVLDRGLVIKWIIESDALNNHQIMHLCQLIRSVISINFSQIDFEKIYVKSSTGYFKKKGVVNGVTADVIELIKENAKPILVKASAGVRTKQDVLNMLKAGASRIGTSSALSIIKNKTSNSDY